MDMRRLGVTAALALALTACGNHTTTLDQQRLDAKIKAWAVRESGPRTRVKVDCPSGIPVKAGTTFHCIVSDQRGKSIRLVVTVENDAGYVTWTTG